ncbi:MAG: phosphoribosylanthranilate isomerase [Betaproteobacteria bacterium]|nr:phosphoribosylanthranilate isomerase [Betaproteobacteria bacterium]
MRTRVKICGIVRPEDARAAADAGADAIGAVFYPPSPVAVDAETAAAVFCAAPPFVETVAVFVNAAPEFVSEIIRRARPSLLQFHGGETAEYCAAFNMPYIKAVCVSDSEDIARAFSEYGGARGILLDAKTPGKYGGGGAQFDWNIIPAARPLPLIVAGGLAAESVGAMVSAHRPWAADVSGGVAADGDKRRKDFAKMKAFILGVRNA